MFKYTKSAIFDSFDFIKKLIYVFQVSIQIFYIGYVGYRIYGKTGNFIANIILLAISILYLLFQIITNNEFYTKEQLKFKKNYKWIFKGSKYLINMYIIVLSILVLVNNKETVNNTEMLLTTIMILAFFSSIVFDVILILIENQITLINSALHYDMQMFKENHGFTTAAVRTVLRLDLDKTFPNLDDEKLVEKVKKANQKQEDKKLRKEDFFSRIKHKLEKKSK